MADLLSGPINDLGQMGWKPAGTVTGTIGAQTMTGNATALATVVVGQTLNIDAVGGLYLVQDVVADGLGGVTITVRPTIVASFTNARCYVSDDPVTDDVRTMLETDAAIEQWWSSWGIGFMYMADETEAPSRSASDADAADTSSFDVAASVFYEREGDTAANWPQVAGVAGYGISTENKNKVRNPQGTIASNLTVVTLNNTLNSGDFLPAFPPWYGLSWFSGNMAAYRATVGGVPGIGVTTIEDISLFATTPGQKCAGAQAIRDQWSANYEGPVTARIVAQCAATTRFGLFILSRPTRGDQYDFRQNTGSTDFRPNTPGSTGRFFQSDMVVEGFTIVQGQAGVPIEIAVTANVKARNQGSYYLFLMTVDAIPMQVTYGSAPWAGNTGGIEFTEAQFELGDTLSRFSPRDNMLERLLSSFQGLADLKVVSGIGGYDYTAAGVSSPTTPAFSTFNYVVPDDVNILWLICQAAGGAGGGVGGAAGPGQGGGGGPGETRMVRLDVIPGETLQFDLGAAGGLTASGNNTGATAGDLVVTRFAPGPIVVVRCKGGTGGGGSTGATFGTNGATPTGGTGGFVIPPTLPALNDQATGFSRSEGGCTLFGKSAANLATAGGKGGVNMGGGWGSGGAGGAHNNSTAVGGDGGAPAGVIIAAFR